MQPIDEDLEQRIRNAAFNWLDARGPQGTCVFRYEDLASFTFEGSRVPLVDRGKGIWKPRFLSGALSIRTVYTDPGDTPPYQDVAGPDGRPRYHYRGTDPEHPDNRALRVAYLHRLPLIWFQGVAGHAYVAIYPVFLIGEEPSEARFVVALDAAQGLVPLEVPLDEDQRRYMDHLTRQRLHQTVFRAQVLTAYDRRCAMCRLQYPSLLDAAHILPDTHPRGTPVVPNGLSLCKIHHAAYDQNLLGVRPDLVVVTRPDVASGIDGPMLRHGLQEMDGVRLFVPETRRARPDPDRLEVRYQEFLSASA